MGPRTRHSRRPGSQADRPGPCGNRGEGPGKRGQPLLSGGGQSRETRRATHGRGGEFGLDRATRGGRKGAPRPWRGQLGVDPYTDNPLLSAKLDEVAKWKRAGGLAVSIGTGAASIWAGIAARTANLVWTQAPEEVRRVNEKRLSSLVPGASAKDIRVFLDNPAFSPTTQTLLVDQLELLPVPRGRDSLVRLAGEMANHDQARFLVAATGLLAAYHERVAPLASVESRGLLAVGMTPAGSLILAVPVDCLAWTERLKEFGGSSDLQAGRREVLITGGVTPRTRQETVDSWMDGPGAIPVIKTPSAKETQK